MQGKLYKETGTKHPTDVYQKAEEVGIYVKVWSVVTIKVDLYPQAMLHG